MQPGKAWRWLGRHLATALLLLAPAPLLATEPPPESGSTCTHGIKGALTEIACEIATHIGPSAGRSVLVASAPVASPAPLLRPDELPTRLSKSVAGQIGQAALVAEGALGLGTARAAATTAGHVVYLRPSIANGQLQVTFDLYPVPRNFWDRVRDTSPNPIEHGYSERRLDAEVSSFMPRVPLVSSRVDRATAETRPVALACGESSEGGSLSLLWVDRHRVALARIRNAALEPHQTQRWSALSAVAPAPIRQPIATAALSPQATWVGLTDRRDALLLGQDLAVIDRLRDRIPWPGVGCLRASATGLEHPEACPPGKRLHLVSDPVRIDTVAAARIVDQQGNPRYLAAWRDADTRLAHVQDDRGAHAEFDDAGAQLALGDLDRDGQPEVISSAPTLDPAGDALIVRTWQRDGRLQERFRLAVPSGISALATCPPEDHGLNAVAVGVDNGVWIVR